jgi:hypothetical protein
MTLESHLLACGYCIRKTKIDPQSFVRVYCLQIIRSSSVLVVTLGWPAIPNVTLTLHNPKENVNLLDRFGDRPTAEG